MTFRQKKEALLLLSIISLIVQHPIGSSWELPETGKADEVARTLSMAYLDHVRTSNKHLVPPLSVQDLTPPVVEAMGHAYLEDEDGHVLLWTKASDPNGTIAQVEAQVVEETSGTTESIELRWNGTHYTGSVYLSYGHRFHYILTVEDGAGNLMQEEAQSTEVEDVVPPRILGAKILDPGNGKLTIIAEVEEHGSGVELAEVVYSVDGGDTWQRGPMAFNGTHYAAQVKVDPGTEVLWTIATRDVAGNVNPVAWPVWVEIPYIPYRIFPSYIFFLLIFLYVMLFPITSKIKSRNRD